MRLRRPEPKKARIEIIPMIDVMFFLLATFMLASLSLQNLHSLAVNLPRGQAPLMQAAKSVTLTITREGRILINQAGVTLDTLVTVLRPMVDGTDTSVILAVDSTSPSGVVIQAMLKARDAGAEHFLFAIQHQ